MATVIKTYTFEEFQDVQKKQKHPHLGLYNVDGSRVVAYNPNGKPVNDKIQEIKRMLCNPQLPDGVYYIKAKASLHPKGATIDYPIIKGDGQDITIQNLAEDVQPLNGDSFDKFNPSVTGFKEVLELRVENEKLKIQNKQYKEEIQELQNEIDELTTDAEQFQLNEKPSMMESLQEFIPTVLQMVSPTIDKHYELKERAIRLQESAQGQPIPGQQKIEPQTSDVSAVNHTDAKIKEYIMAQQDDAELFDLMKGTYNEAENLDDFFNKFKERAGDEHFNALVNHINNGQDERTT